MDKQVISNKFTCVIKNISSLNSESECISSDQFLIGGCKWLLKAYPKGDSMNSSNMSMFLFVADSKSLPYGWRRHAKVSFTIVNQVHDHLSYTKETQEWFDEKVRYWGFVSTIPLSELKDKSNGFLVNGDFKIVVEIGVLEVVGKIDIPEEILCVNGTMDVNGFQVLPSQVQFVKGLFEKYPNIVSNFRPKNQHLKTAYMNVLLNLIEILHKPLVKISNEDLSDAFTSMESLTDIGFKLDFLKKKIKKVMEKKEKEKDCKKRMREIEEELNVSKKKSSDLETLLEKEKQKCSDLEILLEKEKKVLVIAMAPLPFDDAF
ncbi:unnamed protein product [Cochlearia groenlandica]